MRVRSHAWKEAFDIMKRVADRREVVVLAPAWPGGTRGADIALRASLLLYLKHFFLVHYICISDQPFDGADQWPEDRVRWIHASTANSPKWLRFLQSLAGVHPAVAVRYARARRAVMHAVRDIIRRSPESPFLIVEDIPTACLVRCISREFPEIPVAIRSFNIIAKGFEPLCHVGSIVQRLCWRLELMRVRRFEKSVCEAADKFWAISRDDARDYADRLSVRTDGIVGICMDVDRYADVPAGDAKTVVHVGTADLRKGKGLTNFVAEVWPQVRARVADARLVLAGRGTECYADPRLGIEGLGFVDDDRDVLKRGRIFVNTQQIGAGVQLKSIVAMLAGKALVSTPMAAEGIDGEDGEHFVVAKSADQTASRIADLILDTKRTSRIARNARKLGADVYDTASFMRAASPVLDAFINDSPKCRRST